MKVSIVMSCYNSEEFVEESIASILKQTYQNFEFIIVDDGSTDKTLKILKNFSNLDKRIKVIEKKHTCLSDSLNIAINAAETEYIFRMDADDISSNYRIEKQIKYFLKNPNVVLLGSNCKTIDSKGNTIKSYKYSKTNKDLVNNLIYSKKFFPHSSSLFRKSFFDLIGGYQTRLRSEDHDLWLSLSNYGKIHCLQDELLSLRIHQKQMSKNFSMKNDPLIDNKIVIISFLISKYYRNPIRDFTSSEWSIFHNNFIKKIANSKSYIYINEIRSFKKNFKNKKNIQIILEFIKILFNGSLIYYLIYKFYGSKTEKKFATKYLKEQNAI